MEIVLDLDRAQIIQAIGCQVPVQSLGMPYGTGPELRVRVVRSGVAATLEEGFDLRWACKNFEDFDGEVVAYADEITVTGNVVVLPVNYATEALDTLLGSGSSVKLSAQMVWKETAEQDWQLSQNLTLTVHQSVWQGIPGEPPPIPSSFDWLLSVLIQGANTTLTPDEEAGTLTIATTSSLDFADLLEILVEGDGIAFEVDSMAQTITIHAESSVDTLLANFIRYDDAQVVSSTQRLQHATNAGTLVEKRFELLAPSDLVPSSGEWLLPPLARGLAIQSIQLVFHQVAEDSSGASRYNNLNVEFYNGSTEISTFNSSFDIGDLVVPVVNRLSLTPAVGLLVENEVPRVTIYDWSVGGDCGYSATGLSLVVYGVWLDP